MAIKRNKPEKIVTKLRQVEVLVGQGLARINLLQIFLRPLSLWQKAAPLSPLPTFKRTALTRFDATHKLEARLCTIAEEP